MTKMTVWMKKNVKSGCFISKWNQLAPSKTKTNFCFEAKTALSGKRQIELEREIAQQQNTGWKSTRICVVDAIDRHDTTR